MVLKLRRVSLALMMILFCTSMAAQSVLHGTVVDAAGEPVIGASVIVDGGKTTKGTITDFDGNFTLNVSAGTKLKISYVGYNTLNVTAKDGMRVTLEENATMLQGVEVVAYGVQKKVTVTGAISSVKTEDLTRTSISNVSNVLAGQLSGVSAVQWSGEPGSDAATIYLRGKATWGDSAPLIQVDGVERGMNDIDPEEIESITVLKDASATAVFGVRGANGVILITTKRGKEGKTRVNFSTSVSALTPTKLVEQASSYEYASFYNLMNDNDGTARRFDDAIVQKFLDGSDPIRFPSTRWTDYIMKDVSLQTQHNVSISGGTDKVRYFISGGYFSQDGLFKDFELPYEYTHQYKRFNYRANLDIDVTKTTTLSVNLAGSKGNKNRPYSGSGGSSDLIKQVYFASPFSSPGIIDGKYITTGTSYEDGLLLPFTGGSGLSYYGNGFRHSSTNNLQADLQLTQKLDFITKGLAFRMKGSYNSTYSSEKRGQASVASYTPTYLAQYDEYGNVLKNADGQVLYDTSKLYYRKSGETTNPEYSIDTGKARDWYFEAALNWNRSFGLHSLSALMLYNQSKVYYPSTLSDIPRGYVGLVGRVTYDWNNRYMAEFNIGYNGSENFAEDKRFGTFPAMSVGWIASEESFFKPLKKVISYMKLRASWGLVGNDKIGGSRFMYTSDPYSVNATALIDKGGYAYNFGIDNTTLTQAAYLTSMNNPDVTWETAFKQDYGVDINFLDDRLRGIFDYYVEHRKNILLQDGTIPVVAGFGIYTPYANLGKVDSWGWEASLKWQDKIGQDFRYWLGVNVSYNQNEIKEQKEAPQSNIYQYAKGHRIGARSQYLFYGFYNEDMPARYEQEFGKPFPEHQVVELKPGDAVFVDLDGDGKIDGNDYSRDYGFTDDPEYTIGMSMGFQWKRLGLNMQWAGAWNVSRMLSGTFRTPFYSASSKTEGGLLRYITQHSWSVDDPTGDYEYPRPSWDNYDNNYATSTLFEKDAKYLRLKTLQITYDFDFRWMKKIGMNSLQLGLSGYNLLTFSPYIWGDPESRANDSAPTYPLQRTYTLSLKFGF